MIRSIAKVAVVAAAAGGLQLGVIAPAEAQTGFLCGFASITDPTVEGNVQTGEIQGGPLFARDGDNPGEETADITIRCTIQVGAEGATHAGADAYTAISAKTPAVAVLPGHQFTYVAPPGSPVYLCTEATVDDGPSRYFDETGDDATRNWSSSSSAKCALAISQEIETSPLCPVLQELASLGVTGVPGVLEIDDDGDLYIAGVRQVDCEPVGDPA